MNPRRKIGMPSLRYCLTIHLCLTIFSFECTLFLLEQNVEITSQMNKNRAENGSSTTTTEVPFSNSSDASEVPSSDGASIILDTKSVSSNKEFNDHSADWENNKHKDNKNRTRTNRTKSKPQHPSVFVVPDEGADVIFKCTDENDAESTRVRAWVLPNGRVLRPPPEKEVERPSADEGVTTVTESGILVTEYELRIEMIRLGMDGRYVCVMYANRSASDMVSSSPLGDDDYVDKEALLQSANYSRRNFFIPYIVSRGGFPQAAILSLAISVGFCLVCVGILCADRHLRRRSGDVGGDDFVEYYARQQQRNAVSDGTSAAWRAASFGSSGDFGYYGEVGSTDRLTYGVLAMRRKTQVWSTGGEFGLCGYVDGIVAEENDEEIDAEWKRRVEEQAKYFTRSISTIGFDEIPKKTKSEEAGVITDEKKAEVGNQLEVPSNNMPTYSPLQTPKTRPKFAFNADIIPPEDDDGGDGYLSTNLDDVETIICNRLRLTLNLFILHIKGFTAYAREDLHQEARLT